MGFPLVDKRALGWAFVGNPTAPTKIKPQGRPVPFLGARASDAIEEAAKDLEKARVYIQKVHDSFEQLAAVIGDEKANQAYDEAQKGLERAQKDYDDTVEIIGGPR